MYRDVEAIVTGSLLTFALLVILHMTLWPYRDRITRVDAYIVGTVAIGLGVLVASLILGSWLPFAVWFGVVAPGGAFIAVAWWVRGVMQERRARLSGAARLLERVEEHLRAVPAERDDCGR